MGCGCFEYFGIDLSNCIQKKGVESPQTRFTIAIAKIKTSKSSWIAVAGNLGFERKKGRFKDIEVTTLMGGIHNQLYSDGILLDNSKPFIFLKNPFDDGYHMKRHAEMQLTR